MDSTKKRLVHVGIWLIPVILIPMIWPIYAISLMLTICVTSISNFVLNKKLTFGEKIWERLRINSYKLFVIENLDNLTSIGYLIFYTLQDL
jgi:putative flippase GtrA